MNISYIAGFTDGEGNIGVYGRGPRITWGQKHKGVLDEMVKALASLGINTNRSIVSAKPPKRPNAIHILYISTRRDCERLIRMMLPELIVKKEDAEKVLTWMEANPASRNTDPIPIQEFKRLVALGYSQTRIAKQMKLSHSRVWSFAKENSISFSRLGSFYTNGVKGPAMTRAERLSKHRVAARKNKCLDCQRPIYSNHKRCPSCAQKRRHQEKPETFKTYATSCARTATGRFVAQERA